MERGILSEISTSLENASTINDGDLPTTCDVQILELFARVDNSKDTAR